ncbi:MAG: [FeFe] hydrogenase H-cluster maturation GTPase HydF [Mogibacterium sp.]|nr:[FeFe] hydrogenase H-cluster maturation GTPase HydF [Mogibacterium sp.]
MSLNGSPSAERTHIGFFGCRNAGKSSLVNAVTGQALSIVSEIGGTTTDPVQKAMELKPLGPVVIIDTPGLDDEGSLGDLRVKRAEDTLKRVDVAVLVVDAERGLSGFDEALLDRIREMELPHIIAWNKCDLQGALPPTGVEGVLPPAEVEGILPVSSLTGEGVHAFKEALARVIPEDGGVRLAGDLVENGDVVVLVCPIDESAPKGRLILPQQQVIRDLLDAGVLPVVCRETELAKTFERLSGMPKMVITDSQVFSVVSEIVPDEVPLTSFSILMARYKGFLHAAVEGIAAVDGLKDGDKVLLAEGCTHHRQCGDIGSVKIPRWLKKYTGLDLEIETCSGRDFPEDLSPYSLVIHCGGCMLTDTVIKYRMGTALSQGVPFTNYGIAIARMTGTLERSLRVFPELHAFVVSEDNR